MNHCRRAPISTPSRQSVLALLMVMLFVLPFVSVEANAQDDPCQGVVPVAKRDYQRGLFDEASFRLTTCISRNALNEKEEKEAYLLLGQIYYAKQELERARDSIRILLEQDPLLELNPEEHKRGFIDLVGEMKQQLNAEVIQSPPSSRRQGFWFSFGIGPGEGNIRCNCPLLLDALISENDPWKGGAAGSFSLALGGTISPKLQVGAEINQWSREVDGNDRTSAISFLSFVAKYYPNETGNFFLKGGFGFGGATLENNVVKLQSGGAGLHFGLGYDILLGQAKKVAITPYINLNVLYAEEDVQIVNVNDNPIRLEGPTEPSYFQLGVAFTVL